MVLRSIVRIDEEKCTGCGLCIPACAEGALKIVDGKAKLISGKYCDGLGACIGARARQVCGYTVEGDVPARCPICKALKERFKTF